MRSGAPSIEPKGAVQSTLGALREAGGDVFLSARVVDEGAFADFAARLRALIAEANQSADRAAAATEAGKALAPVVGRLRQQLEEAGRTLEAIEARSAEVRALAGAVGEQAQAVARFEADADAIVQNRVRGLETALQSPFETAEVRLKQIQVRLDQLMKPRMEQARSVQSLVDAVIADGERRIEAMKESLGQSALEAQGRAHAAETAAMARVAGLSAELEEACARASARMEAACEVAESRLSRAAEEARARTESLEQIVTTVAGPALAALAESAGTVRTIAEGVASAERTIERMGVEGERLEHLKGHCEEVQRSLAASVLTGASSIDSIESRQATLDRAVDHAMVSCAGAEERVAARVAEGRLAIERQADEMRRLLAESRERRREIEEAAHRARETLAWLERAIEQIEPWRDVLLSDDASGDVELPARIQAIVRQAQEELSRPILELGAILNRASRASEERAERASSPVSAKASKSEKPKSRSRSGR